MRMRATHEISPRGRRDTHTRHTQTIHSSDQATMQLPNRPTAQNMQSVDAPVRMPTHTSTRGPALARRGRG
eukprot:5058657-Pleurochrysis_carterae.AAC.1